MTSIVHSYQWDGPDRQYFVSLSPDKDELCLYESQFTGKSYTTSRLNSTGSFDTVLSYSYSPSHEGLVCAGQSNGTVHVCNLKKPDTPTAKLRPRQSRPCNSVSFNSQGLIAAGFDKVRNDSSVMVWNIENYSSNTSSGDDLSKGPYETFLPSEMVSSVQFLNEQPNSLLCGGNKFLREFDLRSPAPAFQCAAKCSQGIVVNPYNDIYFATYSEDGAFSMWDRRLLKQHQSNGANNTAATSNTSTNNTNSEPALYMSKLFGDNPRKSSFGCFRWSLSNSHEFAIVNDGDLMRRWQVGVVPTLADQVIPTRPSKLVQGPEPESRHSYISRNDTLFVSCVLDSRTDFDKVVAFDYTSDAASPYSVNFMCIRQSGQVFRMKCVESPDAVVFDPSNDVAVVDPERITIVQSSKKHKVRPDSRKNSTATTGRKESESQESTTGTKRRDSEQDAGAKKGKMDKEADRRGKDGEGDGGEGDDDDDDDDDDDEANDDDDGASESGSESENPYFVNPTFEGMLDFRSVLRGDISCIMRKRAENGYSLDCEKNIDLLHNEHGDGYLKYTWQWLLCARNAEQKKSMLSDTLDLGYEGVLGIWEGISGLQGQNRHRIKRPITENDFENTVTTAISKPTKNVFVSPQVAGGSKHARRRLCLRVAGWNFDLAGLKDEMDKLIKQGRYEQAAGWAVFHGDVGRAVDCLASSKKERLRLMSTAVAGYLAYKDSNLNSPWRDQCRKLALELDDPYLRAVFAYISDGSWQDVLDEGSLPLVERLGIALRFLPDDELTTYLKRVADRAVANGDLEGIMLTGITPRVVPLLQSYVDKTSDVQTASLIVSFGATRFFKDRKVDAWIEEYRKLLNSWRMFGPRAKFDVGRKHLAVNYAGENMTAPVPRQIYIRCSHCKKTIGGPSKNSQHQHLHQNQNQRQPTKPSAGGGGGAGGSSTNTASNNKSSNPSITRCPSCNNPLPRCVICLLPLGSYVPNNKSSNGSGAAGALNRQFELWPTYCLSCNHGLHAGHAKQWFSKHNVCPVPDCSCLCNSR